MVQPLTTYAQSRFPVVVVAVVVVLNSVLVVVNVLMAEVVDMLVLVRVVVTTAAVLALVDFEVVSVVSFVVFAVVTVVLVRVVVTVVAVTVVAVCVVAVVVIAFVVVAFVVVAFVVVVRSGGSNDHASSHPNPMAVYCDTGVVHHTTTSLLGMSSMCPTRGGFPYELSITRKLVSDSELHRTLISPPRQRVTVPALVVLGTEYRLTVSLIADPVGALMTRRQFVPW